MMKLLRQKKLTQRPRLGANIKFMRNGDKCFVVSDANFIIARNVHGLSNDDATKILWRAMGAW